MRRVAGAGGGHGCRGFAVDAGPSDVLLGSDGHLVVAPPFPFPDDLPAALLAQALSALDGFGTVTAVFFPLSTT